MKLVATRKLTPEELVALRARVLAGDKDARVAIVESVSAWIFKRAQYYRARAGTHFEDLVHECVAMVIEKVHLWDPELGALTTWSAGWVRHAAQKFLSKTDPAVDYNHGPSGLRAMRQRGRTKSLDAPTSSGDGEESGTLLDLLAGGGPSSEDVLLSKEAKELIESALDVLTPRERLAIQVRWLGVEPGVLKDAGKALGVTRERARQIELVAMAKLANALGADKAGWKGKQAHDRKRTTVVSNNDRWAGRRAEVVALLHKGVRISSICALLAVAKQTVETIAKEEGIDHEHMIVLRDRALPILRDATKALSQKDLVRQGFTTKDAKMACEVLVSRGFAREVSPGRYCMPSKAHLPAFGGGSVATPAPAPATTTKIEIVQAPAATAPAPPPEETATKDELEECPLCGGDVTAVCGEGCLFAGRPVPASIAIPTCASCGEQFLDRDTSDALSIVLDSPGVEDAPLAAPAEDEAGPKPGQHTKAIRRLLIERGTMSCPEIEKALGWASRQAASRTNVISHNGSIEKTNGVCSIPAFTRVAMEAFRDEPERQRAVVEQSGQILDDKTLDLFVSGVDRCRNVWEIGNQIGVSSAAVEYLIERLKAQGRLASRSWSQIVLRARPKKVRATPPWTIRPNEIRVLQDLERGPMRLSRIGLANGWSTEDRNAFFEAMREEGYVQIIDSGRSLLAGRTKKELPFPRVEGEEAPAPSVRTEPPSADLHERPPVPALAASASAAPREEQTTKKETTMTNDVEAEEDPVDDEDDLSEDEARAPDGVVRRVTFTQKIRRLVLTRGYMTVDDIGREFGWNPLQAVIRVNAAHAGASGIRREGEMCCSTAFTQKVMKAFRGDDARYEAVLNGTGQEIDRKVMDLFLEGVESSHGRYRTVGNELGISMRAVDYLISQLSRAGCVQAHAWGSLKLKKATRVKAWEWDLTAEDVGVLQGLGDRAVKIRFVGASQGWRVSKKRAFCETMQAAGILRVFDIGKSLYVQRSSKEIPPKHERHLVVTPYLGSCAAEERGAADPVQAAAEPARVGKRRGGRPATLTPAELRDLERRVRAGESFVDIGRSMRLHPNTLFVIACGHGWVDDDASPGAPKEPTKPRLWCGLLSEDQVERIRGLALEGSSNKDIALSLGLRAGTVQRVISMNGFPRNAPAVAVVELWTGGHCTVEVAERVRDLYARGESIPFIVDDTALHRRTVYRMIEKNGFVRGDATAQAIEPAPSAVAPTSESQPPPEPSMRQAVLDMMTKSPDRREVERALLALPADDVAGHSRLVAAALAREWVHYERWVLKRRVVFRLPVDLDDRDVIRLAKWMRSLVDEDGAHELMLQHRLQLRPGFTLDLELPSSIDRAQVDKIVAWLETLPVRVEEPADAKRMRAAIRRFVNAKAMYAFEDERAGGSSEEAERWLDEELEAAFRLAEIAQETPGIVLPA